MDLTPVLAFHIGAGVLGFLSGTVAVSLRKGSRRHGLAGSVFAASMLGLAASGVYLAVVRSQPGTVLGGVLTFYLVATSWITARRKEGEPGRLDWAALLAVLLLEVVIVTFAIQAWNSPTGMAHGYPIGPYIFLGSVGLLAAVGDVRMLLRGGISGVPRIARHLWRMCFAWFIAAASIFLARQHLFPAFMRKSGMLVLLSFLPLLLLIFWLVRVRFKSAYQKMTAPAPTGSPSLQA